MSSAHDAHAAAALLLDSGCVTLRADEPFRLPSGWASPVYMDCRRLVSLTDARRQLLRQGLALLREHAVLDGLQAVAGAESSGIAPAAWLADVLDLPLQVVRKRAIGNRQIEGLVEPGAQVLLVDDMMAAGYSKHSFVDALLFAGAQVRHALVYFDYGTFEAAASLQARGVTLHALANWQDILTVAHERQSFDTASLAELASFIQDPGAWSLAHGGIAQPGRPSVSPSAE